MELPQMNAVRPVNHRHDWEKSKSTVYSRRMFCQHWLENSMKIISNNIYIFESVKHGILRQLM